MCLNQISTKYKKEDIKEKSKKVHQKILNCFKNHEKLNEINDYSWIVSEAK